MTVYRVAVVGPESSGKSTLVRQLVAAVRRRRIPVAAVGEYAREYYAPATGRRYDPVDAGDIAAIAAGQLRTEERAARQLGAGVLVCDTTPLTCRIWAEEAIGRVPAEISGADDPDRYALHLVTCPDLPWSADPLRVTPGPEVRRRILRRHLELLRGAGAPLVVVSGSDPSQRLARSLKAVETMPGGVGAVTPWPL